MVPQAGETSSSGPLWTRSFIVSGAVTLVAVLAVSISYASIGPAYTADSAGYLSVAENLLEGRGLRTFGSLPTERAGPTEQLASNGDMPLSEWAPLFPVLVALIARLGLAPVDASLIVNVAANTALAFAVLLAARILLERRSVFVPCIVAGLVTLAPASFTFIGGGSPAAQGAVILSEPMFTALLLGAVLVVSVGLTRLTVGWIALSCAAVAVATMTRYPGAVVGIGCGFALLTMRIWPIRRRAFGALMIAACGPIVLVGFVQLNRWLNDAASAKAVGWHPVSGQLRQLIETMAAWFAVPPSWPLLMDATVVALGVVLPICLVFIARSTSECRTAIVATMLARSLAATSVAYVGAVLASQVVLDAVAPMNQRLLAPIQPMIYLVATSVAVRPLLSRTWSWTSRAGIGVSVAIVASVMILSAPADPWASRDLLDALAQAQQAKVRDAPYASLAELSPVFSNDPSALYLFGGVRSYVIPFGTTLTTTERNEDYESDIAAVVDAVGDTGAVVLFRTLPSLTVDARDYERAGLSTLAVCDDGTTILGRQSSRRVHEVALLCDASDVRVP